MLPIDENLSIMADWLNTAVNNPDDAVSLLQQLKQDLDILAAREASKGRFSASMISTMEDLDPEDKMAQKFWDVRALMAMKVYNLAATRLVHWK